MLIAEIFRNEPPGEIRLSIAVVASFLLHASVIAGVGITLPDYSAPRTLRASIVPLSLPNVPLLEQAQVSEAARELAAMDTAPRKPVPETAAVEPPRQITEQQAAPPAGIAANPPIYYRNDEVDVRATPRRIDSPSRESRSLMLGRMVKVKLRLFISDTGLLDHYEVLESEGMSASIPLDDLKELNFYPAQRNGRPVRSQKVVELTFIAS